MKNLLGYYYNVYPEYIYKNDTGYYFYINKIKYFFVLVNNKNIDSLVELSNNLYNKKIMVHTFIMAKNNTYVVPYDNNNYSLLRINCDDDCKVKLKDIVNFNNILLGNNNVRNYSSLWSNEVDDIEEEIIDFNKEHKIITDYINYYIGLAENAIEYYKDNVNESTFVSSIGHIKITYNMTYFDFYNPLNFVIDHRVRDLSEYVKSIFFNTLDSVRIINIVNSLNISKEEACVFYCRMLYPNYYFNIYNDVLDGKIDEEKVNEILKLSLEYEILLNDIQNIFHKKYGIPLIKWLKKN